MKMNLKRSAFTLAETLIVMGIIGVIAALTIPTLSNETNSKETVTKLKKTQAILEDAFGRAEAQYGTLSEWTTLNTSVFTQRISATMKTSKVCSLTSDDSGCFGTLASANAYKPDGTITTALKTSSVGKLILADESSIGFMITDGNCNTPVVLDAQKQQLPDLQKVCGTVTVDINGPSKGKSLWGKDLFAFYITNHGLYPVGMDGDKFAKFKENCIATVATGKGTGCTAWVVTNGNLDYTDVDSAGKCLKGNTSATLAWANETSCR